MIPGFVSNRFGGKLLGTSSNGDVQTAPATTMNRISANSQPKKTFKPAPPVTTPPPPRRQSIPLAPSQSLPRSSTLQQPRKSLPAKSLTLPPLSSHQYNDTEQSPHETLTSEGLPGSLQGDAQSSPPALPPRRVSAPAPLIANDISISENRPPLPARREVGNDSLALVLIEQCPPLPARTYKVPESTALALIEPPPPMLPPRTYRVSVAPVVNAPVGRAAVARKPPQLTSTSLTTCPPPIAEKPNIERVSSNSSTSSSSSAQTVGSMVSNAASVSTSISSTSEPPENLGFAELRKKFEARNTSAGPELGKQFQKVM